MAKGDDSIEWSEIRAATRELDEIIVFVDPEDRQIFANDAAARLAKVESARTAVGRPIHSCGFPAPCADQWQAMAAEVFETQQSVRRDFELADRSDTHFSTAASPIRGRDGAVLAVCLITRDVSEQARASRALRNSELRLERALEASGLGLLEWNLENDRLYLDDRCRQILGISEDSSELTMTRFGERVHPDDLHITRGIVLSHFNGENESVPIEWRFRVGDEYRWISTSGRVTERSPDGRVRQISGTIRDVDASHRVKVNLDATRQQLRHLLDATLEGIIGLDADGVCTIANPAALNILGVEAEALIGQPFLQVIRHTDGRGRTIDESESPIVACLARGGHHRSADDMFWRSDKIGVSIEYSISSVDGADTHDGAVLVFHDTSETRALARKLEYQALHDPLTGLINRRGFEARLSELLQSAKQRKAQHALCYLDLDHFKVVNDTCGHAAGDELLRQLPKVMHAHVRSRDVLARLGGDEFAILLEDCPLETAAEIAGKIRDSVRDYRFNWQFRSFRVGVSVGVTSITAESGGLVSVLGAADTACYVAKDHGPNNIHVSYPHDLAIIRRRGEMRWVARLKHALEENEFCFYCQPIVPADAGSEAYTSHELLLRLRSNKGEVIGPAAFLPAAERYQLMPTIDAWVVRNAMAFLGERRRRFPALDAHSFGINLSGDSIRDATLYDTIERAMREHDVPPRMVYFEITETAAIANIGAALDLMRRLKKLGCRMALDDFGSGMSSFSYLKNLPVDYLKIDGSFIRDILENPVDQSIVEAVNTVAQRMGLKTVAEFVENDAVRQCVRDIGVDYVQGYGIGGAVPLESLPVFDENTAEPMPSAQSG